MSQHFNLAYNIALDNFIIKLYHFDGETDYVEQSAIDSMISQLNSCSTAREILTAVEQLIGITKIEIFDLEYNLLIDQAFTIE